MKMKAEAIRKVLDGHVEKQAKFDRDAALYALQGPLTRRRYLQFLALLEDSRTVYLCITMTPPAAMLAALKLPLGRPFS